MCATVDICIYIHIINLSIASFDIFTENVAHTAFHNSGARFDPPKCHPNTRVAILQKIMDWIRSTDCETFNRHILWLTGAAGAGKSAIAQTIIELCLAEGFIIASFLFFRSDGSRNNGKILIATGHTSFSVIASERARDQRSLA